MSRITLEKKGDSHISQIKQESVKDEIVVNLNWNQEPRKKSGFLSNLLKNRDSAIDLDLGCFFELSNGYKSVIDGLQFSKKQGGSRTQSTLQGCYIGEPWVWHTGDDRSGSQMATGESILINPQGYDDIRRLTIYAYIYEGVSKWEQCNAVITIKVPGS